VWSIGVIAYVLLTGRMPFGGSKQEQKDNIRAGRFGRDTSSWSELPEIAQDFVQRTLIVDPSMRLTARQALCHPWVASSMFVQAQAQDSGMLVLGPWAVHEACPTEFAPLCSKDKFGDALPSAEGKIKVEACIGFATHVGPKRRKSAVESVEPPAKRCRQSSEIDCVQSWRIAAARSGA